MLGPDKNAIYPLKNYNRLCFLKNIITNPNILIGDYTYYDDFEDIHNFEKNVKYHFDFIGDKLIIGKFCMIASGATFIMGGANHRMDGITTYPFTIFGHGWETITPTLNDLSLKGDTIIGNDVWIGTNATIMPGVHIGDGAIIATNATVTKHVEPYAIVGGNPAREIRKRFSTQQIKELLEIQWWNWDIEKITANLHHLVNNNIDKLKTNSSV
ncbi:Vat family streptogramin A O-acetyltransferase [Beggiatoa leptomitoformis]|uniref:Vat family streptogramin A O-acetyltransferase n=1 Tax=Beggiatoa leptomitoformis TaxID=288004 RepID=A0A2N9YF48_9GAMM|nr:Vat family streptogramin A O-acetyltransferase [Beggiatoa leptomitoformis]AUI69118.1 Vat family streptogramin A O-acetyltransferase [Beggiatoa leptomitoformis]